VRVAWLACWVACLVGGAIAKTPPNLGTASILLKNAAIAQGVEWPIVSPSILIEKEKRTLTLLVGGRALRAYRIGLGAEPHLDKDRAGDHRTPEGIFYVCSRNPASQFHLFLGISYPGSKEADRGLRQHLINTVQAKAIRSAVANRQLPPQFTGLGGLIGIHGGGSGSDWTWGCIALEDVAVEELWVACPIGTPIEIRK